MSAATNPLAQAVIDAGNQNAGILLYRLRYWQPRAKVRRGSHKWVVKSRDEWAKETGLSFDQYKRALARLVRDGLVVSERHLFANKTTAFLRLPCANQLVQDCANQLVQKTPDPITLSLNTEAIVSNDTIGACGPLPEAPEGLAPKSPDGLSTMQSTEAETMAKAAKTTKLSPFKKGSKVADIVSASEKPSPKIGTLNKASDVEVAWRQARPGVFHQKWTIPELGKAGLLLKALGPKRCLDVVRGVVPQWGGFTAYVQEQAGVFSVPLAPTLGFVLKHHGHALAFVKASKDAPVPADSGWTEFKGY